LALFAAFGQPKGLFSQQSQCLGHDSRFPVPLQNRELLAVTGNTSPEQANNSALIFSLIAEHGRESTRARLPGAARQVWHPYAALFAGLIVLLI
jgi:hypothetical protein